MHLGQIGTQNTRTKTVYYINLSYCLAIQVDKFVAKCVDIVTNLLRFVAIMPGCPFDQDRISASSVDRATPASWSICGSTSS